MSSAIRDWFKRTTPEQRIQFIVSAAFIGIFAVSGLHYLVTTHAATATAQLEAEAGTQSGTTVLGDSSASGNSAVRFNVATANNSALPFTMPSKAVLQASTRKVFGVYFPPFPLSLDNKASNVDYYTNQFTNPAGQNNLYLAEGGEFRQRPLPIPVDPSPNWKLNDMKIEVRHAQEAGLDGFVVDPLSQPGANNNWSYTTTLISAAEAVDPNFKIILEPDCTTGDVTDINNLTAAYATVADSPNMYRLSDGRLVISPFYPEDSTCGASYWANFINIMKTKYSVNVALVPEFLNYGSANAAFNSISYGFSNWGDRSIATNNNLAPNINDAHSKGKIWMQPVSLQDVRPNQHNFYEADNTENLRATWNGAINNGADWVYIPTWNDYSEGAEIAPSTHIGWAPLDISAYYLVKYKTGSFPTINKDVLYLSHRVQFANAKPPANTTTGANTKLMTVRSNSSPARDMVEILSFLTAPATITVKIGGTTQTYSAPAGEFSQDYPLQVGSVSVTAVRAGTTVASINSPFSVLSTPPVQDEQYYYLSSARSNNGIGTASD